MGPLIYRKHNYLQYNAVVWIREWFAELTNSVLLVLFMVIWLFGGFVIKEKALGGLRQPLCWIKMKLVADSTRESAKHPEGPEPGPEMWPLSSGKGLYH